MDKFINIFIAPQKVFTGLKEKPEWCKPFFVVLILIAVITVLSTMLTTDLRLAKFEETVPQIEEMLKDRGMSEDEIAQHMEESRSFTTGPLAIVFAAIGTPLFTAIVLLVFAAILNLFIPLFGGIGIFKKVFSVISFSALVKVLANILRLILIIGSRSLEVTTSLALFFPFLTKRSFSYQFLANLDLFLIWEMALVGFGISITNNLKKERAFILVFLIWFISILMSIGIGGLVMPRT